MWGRPNDPKWATHPNLDWALVELPSSVYALPGHGLLAPWDDLPRPQVPPSELSGDDLLAPWDDLLALWDDFPPPQVTPSELSGDDLLAPRDDIPPAQVPPSELAEAGKLVTVATSHGKFNGTLSSIPSYLAMSKHSTTLTRIWTLSLNVDHGMISLRF